MKKLFQDKRIKERPKKILPLLQEGKTVREVAELLGYVSPNSVYCYIHQHKLREKTTITPAPKRGRPPLPPKPPKPPKIPKPPKLPKPKKIVLPPPPKRSEQIVPLFLQGKTVEEIQEILHYKVRASVCNHLRSHNFSVPALPRGRKKKIKPPTPAQPPVCHSPEKTVSSAKRISLRQRARRIIPLYKQGETVEGIAARLDLSVKNVFYWLQFHGFIYAESGNPTDYILPLYEFGFSPEEIQDLFGYMKLETILSRLRQEK